MIPSLKLALVALVAVPLAASPQEDAATKDGGAANAPAGTNEPAAAKGPTLKLSGLVDSYYTANLDYGQGYASPTASAEPGFYTSEPGFNLNFAKLTAEAESDAAALRLDVGLAKEGSVIGSRAPDPESKLALSTFVQQAYASYRFPVLTLEAGRFITPAGFESYEAQENWLYSRGLLFNFTTPTGHEGVRVAVPFGPLTATAYLANGSDLWSNDVGFTGSPYKTGILNLAYEAGGTTAAVTGLYTYVPGTERRSAYQVDAYVTREVGPVAVNLAGDLVEVDGSRIYGAGAQAKLEVMPAVAVMGRVEWLKDEDGIRVQAGRDPAARIRNLHVLSYTAGVSYAVGSSAALKGEVRIDTASRDFYGPQEDGRSVATATVGAIAWF